MNILSSIASKRNPQGIELVSISNASKGRHSQTHRRTLGSLSKQQEVVGCKGFEILGVVRDFRDRPIIHNSFYLAQEVC